MLENRFESIQDLWLRKTLRKPPKELNGNMLHGQTYEQAAREALGAQVGDFFSPVCMVHDDFAWMRASLDGWNGTVPAEIKCPTTIEKWMEMSAAVPIYYRAQIQHQLAVSAARVCYFWVYVPATEQLGEARGNLIVVERDEAYITELIRREQQFQRCLELDTYPPTSFFEERIRGL